MRLYWQSYPVFLRDKEYPIGTGVSCNSIAISVSEISETFFTVPLEPFPDLFGGSSLMLEPIPDLFGCLFLALEPNPDLRLRADLGLESDLGP